MVELYSQINCWLEYWKYSFGFHWWIFKHASNVTACLQLWYAKCFLRFNEDFNFFNLDDWETIFNNFTKFGLGLFSILFDILFILQHYVFYRHSENKSTSQTSLFTNINSTESGNDKKELSEKTKMESTLPNGSHTQYT